MQDFRKTFEIFLKNGKKFPCFNNQTIFDAAITAGIPLEHSCLAARCRSCIVKIKEGTAIDKNFDYVLSLEDKESNYTLSCNAIPTSDLILDLEDLGECRIFDKKIVPAKIEEINKLNDSVIQVTMRLPPNSNFGYNSGQYVNIIKGQIKRSYSIANAYQSNGFLTFLIKKYENGLMSRYWFEEARINDLLRIEGPVGSFFLRETEIENIVFLATGTGVAPIKAMLEEIYESEKYISKKYWVFVGARYEKDLFLNLNKFNIISNLTYVPVLSRGSEDWNGERGYVQEILIKYNIPLINAQVYACGSNDMIESAKKLLIEKGLNNKNFFSDAFLATN
jgi:CDP-4-dehydro-6-deoxyglucose reductase